MKNPGDPERAGLHANLKGTLALALLLAGAAPLAAQTAASSPPAAATPAPEAPAVKMDQ